MKLKSLLQFAFLKALLASLCTQAGTYLTILLLTRMLGVDQFGRYGAIQATLTAAFGIANLGIGVTATRFVARYRRTDPDRAGRILGLCSLISISSGLAFTLALWTFSAQVAVHLFGSPELNAAVRTSAFCCLLLTLNANLSGMLLGFEAFSRLLRAQILQSASAFAATWMLVSAFGFQGAVLALPLSALLGYLFLAREAHAECSAHSIHVQLKNCWRERQVLYQFALPAAASGMIGSAAVWAAQMLLVSSSSGMTQMGLWSAAASIRGAVLLAPGVLNRVSGPILAGLHDHSQGTTYSRTLWANSAVATLGAAAACLLLLAAGPLLINWFGKGYASSIDLLPIVLASALVEAYAGSVAQALIAHGRLKLQLWIISAWAVTLLLVAWLAIPGYAAQGLALAYLLSWATTAAGYTLIARRLLQERGQGQLAHA